MNHSDCSKLCASSITVDTSLAWQRLATQKKHCHPVSVTFLWKECFVEIKSVPDAHVQQLLVNGVMFSAQGCRWTTKGDHSSWDVVHSWTVGSKLKDLVIVPVLFSFVLRHLNDQQNKHSLHFLCATIKEGRTLTAYCSWPLSCHFLPFQCYRCGNIDLLAIFSVLS